MCIYIYIYTWISHMAMGHPGVHLISKDSTTVRCLVALKFNIMKANFRDEHSHGNHWKKRNNPNMNMYICINIYIYSYINISIY